MGFDQTVRIWCPVSGDPLGTLEQGLSEGLQYKRRTIWRFPIDARVQVEKDLKELAEAALVSEAGSDEEGNSKEASDDGKAQGAEQGKKKDDAGSDKGVQKSQLLRSGSLPTGLGSAAKKPGFKLNGIEYPDYTKAASRLLQPTASTKTKYSLEDWFAGPLGSQSHTALPQLQSGLQRKPDAKTKNAVVEAAKKLSKVLSSLEAKKMDSSW